MINGAYHNVNTDIFFPERGIMGNFYSFIYFLLTYSVATKAENVNNSILPCLQCHNNKPFIMYSKLSGCPDHFFYFYG